MNAAARTAANASTARRIWPRPTYASSDRRDQRRVELRRRRRTEQREAQGARPRNVSAAAQAESAAGKRSNAFSVIGPRKAGATLGHHDGRESRAACRQARRWLRCRTRARTGGTRLRSAIRQGRHRERGNRAGRELERESRPVGDVPVHDLLAVQTVEPGVGFARAAPQADGRQRARCDEDDRPEQERPLHRRSDARTPMPAAHSTKSSGRLA